MSGAVVLVIDASVYAGSVCVARGRDVLAEVTTPMRGEHEERLMPAVPAALDAAGVALDAVERVACGAGPGSFTSLRIAASIAKGIASARGLPLLALPSLALMVAADERTREPGEYLAVLDALRGQAYAARCVVRDGGDVVAVDDAVLLSLDEVTEREARGARVVGPGRAIDAAPHARGVVRMRALLDASVPVSLAGWEPSYGRPAEAQAQWEAKHGRPLPVG